MKLPPHFRQSCGQLVSVSPASHVPLGQEDEPPDDELDELEDVELPPDEAPEDDDVPPDDVPPDDVPPDDDDVPPEEPDELLEPLSVAVPSGAT